ncbi:MAG: methyltransferase domain-containing protein [Clostridia bacterium]|nr:methyltransferase domain-containing protein [Clostridia bacterium]
MGFICPKCKKPLKIIDNAMKCGENHSYDISKFGYVNLLLSQKSSKKRHGDDKLMARSRRDFLDKGYYSHLLEKLRELSLKYGANGGDFLDLGCGECYYSSNIQHFLKEKGVEMGFYGIDISKDILAVGSKRGGINLAVASASELPFADESLDIVMSVFAPSFDDTVRVLKKGGTYIKVIPLERHLIELKEAVYDEVYLNKGENEALSGLELTEKYDLEQMIHLENNADIDALFKMTPYYYKTSQKDQEKLTKLDTLDVLTQFRVLVYRK